jgi:DNA-binding transcriptional regulator YdaS (Cro superfamily)
MTPRKAFAAAIDALGTKAALARALNVSPQAVSQWDYVPVAHVLRVEALTGVSRQELRPDIYPADRRHP